MVAKCVQRRLAANNAADVAGCGGRLRASVIYLVCATLVLASCTTYKARLEPRSEPRSGIETLPSPTEDWKLVEAGQNENVTGWVRLRFDVSAAGEVRGARIIESSDERLGEKAVAMLASWSFEPGTIDGEPAKFEDIEYMMAFFEETAETSGVAGAVMLGVIAVGVVAILIAVSLKRNCGVVTDC